MIFNIKQHRVKHGSITLGIDDLMQGEMADIIYSDPPWGGGNVKYWQTMNNKDNGAPKEDIDFGHFLNMIFSTYQKYCKNILLIEYGCQWNKELKAKAAEYGFKDFGTIKLLYRSGSKMLPLDLHLFAKTSLEIPAGYVASVQNTYGYDTLKKALAPFTRPGMTILDPMCGMGYTAQYAIDNGMRFLGNELNRKRLQKTIDRLSK